MQSIADFKPVKKLLLPVEQRTFENEWHVIKEPGDTSGIFITRCAEIEGCKPIKQPKHKSNPIKRDVRMQMMMERIF